MGRGYSRGGSVLPDRPDQADSEGQNGEDAVMNRVITPSAIAPPVANYAHAVVSEGAGRWLHTAGVVGIAPDGSVPAGLAAQAGVVWANITAILSEAGMTVRDIVSVTTHVVVGEELGPVMGARDRAMAGHLAASTLVTVPALARPEWRVEVAIVAFAT
jgi:2-iminobutanoate/2-iminopropanoate deaminase